MRHRLEILVLLTSALLTPACYGVTLSASNPLPTATVGVAWSYTPTITAGCGTYFLSWTGGPSGIGTFNGTSNPPLDGTFSTPGTYSMTITAHEQFCGSGTSNTVNTTFTVAYPLSIATTSLPNGAPGTAYSQTISSSGGAGTVTWSLVTGSLPSGLTLSPAGLISGTPSVTGTYNFTVKATDQWAPTPGTQTQALSITVTSPLALPGATLPNGLASTAYSTSAITASGGTGSYSWTLVSGSYPPGITGSCGGTGCSQLVLSGTPTTPGTYPFTVKVTDTASAWAQQSYSIYVLAWPTLGVDYPQVNEVISGNYVATGWLLNTQTTISTIKVYLDGTGAGNLLGTANYGSNRSDVCALAQYSSAPNCPNVGWNYTIPVGSYATGAHTIYWYIADNQGVTNWGSTAVTFASSLSITTSSLASRPATTAYSASLTATGGTPPYTWSITSGSLPPGLSLSGNTISGTPTTAGTYNFTVTVTDSEVPANQTTSKALSITIGAALSVTTTSLPNALATTPYTATLGATGGTSPYTWSITTGSLPTGLSLASDGALSGTPTAAGTSSFTVKATDSTSPTAQTATKSLSITVGPALSITTASLPAAVQSSTYSYSLTATGGTPTYTWSISTGSLPSGLTLGSTGAISGTPTVAGTYNFTVHATDNTSPTAQTATQPLSIVVGAALSITTTSLPAGLATTAYSTSLNATGGTSPYTWSITTGSLPPGLSLASSSGTVSGTPTTAGTYNFTVQTTDSTSPTAQTGTKALSISISAALAVTTSSLPNGLASTAYSTTLAASGGTPGYTWSIASGSLPTGLTLSTAGAISGTPSSAGTYNITFQVTDSTSPTPQTVTKALALTIGAPLSITTTSPLPNGLQSSAYNVALGATGGTTPYTWTLAAGSPSSGLTLNSNGTLSGTPSVATATTFSAQVTDSTSPTPQIAIKALSITIGAQLSINTTTLPNGLESTPYSQTLSATGGTPGYSWSVTGGSLPTGLALTGATISGTPTTSGAYNFTIQATDSTSPTPQTATQSYSVVITAALSISTATPLPTAVVGTTYNQPLAATGGTSLYAWAVTSGSLPPGMSLSGAGVITGNPTTPGTSTVTVQVTDATLPTHQTATKTFSITVNASLVITTATLPNAIQGQAYSQTLAASGGIPPYAWSITTGSLPAGLTLDSAAGTISGTSTASGPFNITVKVQDSSSNYTTRNFNVTVNSAVQITTASPLPGGVVGTAYTLSFSGNGGVAPFTWTVSAGTLPVGLTLSSNGTLSGTPATAGTGNFSIQLADSGTPGQTTTKAFALSIVQPLVLTTSSLPNAVQGQAYSTTLAATGGYTPYTWSITGSLPAGLSLDSAAGTVSGTPTASGSFPLTLKVTDNASTTATKAVTLTVIAPLSITSASPITGGTVGSAYSQTLAATGGVMPYTWTVSLGSLPAGLSLDSTMGKITGSPTTAGTSNFTIQLVDSGTPGQTTTKAFALTVVQPLLLTTSSLPNALQGQAYSTTLAATGGYTPYTWSITGSLPAGLSLDPTAGTISGAPTTSGSFPFTLKVTDNASTTATKAVTLTVIAPLAITSASPLTGGTVGSAYSQTLAATGGVTPYTWTVSVGSLPAGLSLDSTVGKITGTPTTAATSNFTIQLADSGTPDQTTTQPFSLTVVQPLVLTTSSLPNAIQGQTYSTTLAASGGYTPYTWSIAGGSLPAGLASGSSGTISGTPIETDSFSLTFKVTDNASNTDAKTLTLTVIPTLSITTPSLPSALTNNSYSQALVAAGGVSPYSWSVTSGSLPNGLSLDAASGNITGTPTAAGTYPFTVTVTDATTPGQQTASHSYSIAVNIPFVITTATLPDGYVSVPYAHLVTATGGTPSPQPGSLSGYDWTVNNPLPPGLSLLTPNIVAWSEPTLAQIPQISADITQASFTENGLTNGLHFPPTAITDTAYYTPALSPNTPYTLSLYVVMDDGSAARVAESSASGDFSLILAWNFTGTPTVQNISGSLYRVIASGTTPASISSNYTGISRYASQSGKGFRITGVQLTTGNLVLPYAPTTNVLPSVAIAGTPTASGPYSFSIQATDASVPAPQTASQLYTVHIGDALTIMTSLLPNAVTAQTYSATLTATGGALPYNWSSTSGSLPAGLSLDANAGTITGTPTASGTFPLTVTATDPALNVANKSLTLTVIPALTVTTAALPGAIAGNIYNQTLTAAGGVSPYTWSVSSGSVPAGLALGASGSLSGQLSTPGTFTFTAQATDSGSPSQTATKTFTVTIVTPVAITTTSLPNAIQGQPYSTTLTAIDGYTPYTWSLSFGPLPPGISLDPTSGAITGTPMASGTFSLIFKVVDNSSGSASKSLPLTVIPALGITTASLPLPVVGALYSQTITAAGGVSPYSWSIASGSLPPGLSLDATAGKVSGTATTAGTSTFSIQVADAGNPAQTATRQYTLAAVDPLAITTTNIPDAIQGQTYCTTFAATGGLAPYTWTVTTGLLPTGLSLNASTGAITGVPTASGSFNISIKLLDTNNTSVTKAYTMTVIAPLFIATASLPNGTVGVPYNQTLSATGGVAPYTWTTGSLPPGLSLTTAGLLSGTPITPGTSTFTVQVTDSGTPSQNPTQQFTIAIIQPLAFTTTSLPTGIQGQPYSAQLTATGGVTPYIWTLVSGSLPTGLGIDGNTGVISGTPTVSGTFALTIRVADSNTSNQVKTLSLVVAQPPQITTTTLPAAITGTAYSQTLAATGGVTPYSWSITAGSLAAGLSLAVDGTISGTPTATTTSTITVQVADSATPGQTAAQQFTIAVVDPLAISPASLADGIQGTPYSATLAASGGTKPYRWSVKTGTLPAGLSLDQTTGAIIGTPTATATVSLTVQVADTTTPAQTATKTFTLAIRAPLTITTTTLPHGREGNSYSRGVIATGGAAPYTWSITTGALPQGLSLDASTGVISGTAATIGTSTFTVQVTDSGAPSQTTAQQLTIVVDQSFGIDTAGNLTPGTQNVPYTYTLSASNGTTPYNWAITTGLLPSGLSLSKSGTISGIPTAAGTFTFTVQATDGTTPTARSASAALSLTIQPQLVLQPTSLPDTVVGANYSQPLTTSGGVTPYTWTLASGKLPPGLSLDTAGNITGIPTTAGACTFTITITDSSTPNQTVTRPFTINVGLSITITTPSLADGYIGKAYTQSLTALGGITPYSWTILNGSLPTGLTLSSSLGTISGTPVASGLFNVTIGVSDSATPAHTASKPYTLQIRSSLTITTPSLPDAQVGIAYAQSLAATNGTTPYTWTLASGSMPAGISLDPTGNLTGTPTAVGTSTFTIAVADSSTAQLHDSKSFTLNVVNGFRITTTTIPPAAPNTPYTTPFNATGGTTPYKWATTTGTIPPGLVLDSSTGVLSGTPTANGSYSFTVQATDATGATAARVFSLPVGPALTITTTTLKDASLGVLYRQSLSAQNGSAPYLWTLTTGQLPDGLLLLASGDIIGQPTTAGTATFTLTVSDSAQPPATASQTFTLTVLPGFTITTSTLPHAAPGQPYLMPLTAINGTTPYTFSITLGALPDGINLSAAGVLSGTPKQPRPYPLLIQATDSSNPQLTTTRQFLLMVDTDLSVTTALLPNAATGAIYDTGLAANNGLTPYTWTADSLPPGLTLLSTGELYGATTVAGEYQINFTVTDSSQPPATATRALRLLVTRDLAIITDNIPTGLVGHAYSTAITAAGGRPRYSFSASGTLPPGLSLTDDGILSGTPTQEGSYSITISVTDQGNTTQKYRFTIVIGTTLAVARATVPTATTGQMYYTFLSAVGGTAPYTWTADSLPSGLTLVPSLGLIVGTASQAGNYTLNVTVTDSANPAGTATTQVTLTVALQLTIPPAELPTAPSRSSYVANFVAQGGTPPYHWAADSTTMPIGLSLNTNGTLQGTTQAQPDTVSLSVCVTDSATPPAHACDVRTLVIGPAFQINPLALAPTPRGRLVTYQFSTTGAQGAPTFSTAFSLPSGLTLTADGLLSGTPVTSGQYPLTIIATDSAAHTAARDFNLTVPPPLMILTTSLPPATLNARYVAALTATSGTAPYTWSIVSGSLPTGLTLDASGILSGSTTTAGSYPLTLTVTDAAGQTATASLTLTVASPLAITTATLPDGFVNNPYDAQIQATSGVTPYTWTLATGSLPDKMTLGSDGSISGTPTKPGLSVFVITVTDANGQVAGVALSINIADALSIPASSTALSDGTVGVAYSAQLTTNYGANVTWSIVLGDLPPGLTLDASGAITGIPITPGPTSFIARATSGAQHVDQLYSIQINAPKPPTSAALTISDAILSPGSTSVAYRALLTATGGTPPYTWTVADGTLPPGLALTPDGILGTPTTAGIYRAIVAVKDATSQRATAMFSIVIRQALATDGILNLDQRLNTPANVSLNVTGGTPPYTWTLSSGTLPPGLTLSPGTIVGIPTTAGSYTTVLAVHDSAQPQQTATTTINFHVSARLAITTTSIPPAYPQLAYHAALTATGGTPPYRWTVIIGSLPAGLTFTQDGIITGIPTQQGSYPFTASVTDALGQTTSATLTLTVASLTITTTALPYGTPQTPYSFVLAATGGVPPYKWSLASGSLPAGLTLNQDGLLAGTPTAAAHVTITIQVTDTASMHASADFDLTIGLPPIGPLHITSLADPSAPANQTLITVTLDTTPPLDLAGSLNLQFTPLQSGRDDQATTLLRTDGSATRNLSFTVPTGSKTASFTGGPAKVQIGTLAGSIVLTATIAPAGQTPAMATTSTHLFAAAPVITSARVTIRDSYSLELEINGYSTTGEVQIASFAFSGTGTLPPPETLHVQDLFNTWYLSQDGKTQGGTFKYSQKFNFTAPGDGLTSVTITLTNTIGPNQPYKLTL